MKSYVIHFIRHGAIDETLSGKYIGSTDVPLSDKGREALRKLERECRSLELWLRDPRATSSDSARYRVLFNELRRARHYAEEERRDARSAEREYRIREEVAVKRSSLSTSRFPWE